MGSWAPEAGGDAFYYGGSATDGTYLYLFGGYQYGAVTTYPAVYRQLRRYDPAGNAWITLQPMNAPTIYNSGACFGGRIFSFGGYDYTGSGFAGLIHAYTISSNSWQTLSATLSTPRYYAASATLGSDIYITGGYDLAAETYSNRTERFDPATDSITQRADMPAGLYIHASAAVPALNKLYVMGGYNSGVSGSCYEYSPVANAWSTRASIGDGSGLQMGRYYAAAFALNDRVYLTGGYSNAYQATTLEYNPVTNLWARRADMPTPRALHAAIAIGGKGYVYGGLPSLTTGEEFTPPDDPLDPAPDPLAGSWAPEEPGFTFITGGSATNGNYLYVFGGYQYVTGLLDPYYFQQLRRYDPAANSWTTLQQMPVPVLSNAGAYCNGRLYSFGGTLESGISGAIQAYTISTSTWQTLSTALSPSRYSAAAATIGTRIYITGGATDVSLAGDRTDEFNTANNSITPRAALPKGVASHAIAAVEASGKVYVLGGFDSVTTFDDCLEYDPGANTWTSRAPITNGSGVPQPRAGGAAFTLGNRVYLTGGAGPWRTTLEYSPSTDSWARRADMEHGRSSHAAVAIKGKGYVYGGSYTSGTGEEFTRADMPDDPVPDLPADSDSGGGDAKPCGFGATSHGLSLTGLILGLALLAILFRRA